MDLPFANILCVQTSTQRSAGPLRRLTRGSFDSMFSPDPKLEKGTVLEQGSLPFIDVLLSHLMMIISKPTAAHLQTHTGVSSGRR